MMTMTDDGVRFSLIRPPAVRWLMVETDAIDGDAFFDDPFRKVPTRIQASLASLITEAIVGDQQILLATGDEVDCSSYDLLPLGPFAERTKRYCSCLPTPQCTSCVTSSFHVAEGKGQR